MIKVGDKLKSTGSDYWIPEFREKIVTVTKVNKRTIEVIDDKKLIGVIDKVALRNKLLIPL